MKRFYLVLLLSGSILSVLQAQQLKYRCNTPFWGMADEMIKNRNLIQAGFYDNPYTMFNRKVMWSNAWDVDKVIVLIRREIQHLGPVNDAYTELFDNADLTIDTNQTGTGNNNVSPLARWAKNNAFVFLVGVDKRGRSLDSLDPTFTTRNKYRNNAMAAFFQLGVDVTGEENEVQFVSRTLIMWLEAYDMLKTCEKLSELHSADTSQFCQNSGMRYPLLERDHDRNDGVCSPQNKLRYFMYDFCGQADDVINSSTGWKRNHG